MWKTRESGDYTYGDSLQPLIHPVFRPHALQVVDRAVVGGMRTVSSDCRSATAATSQGLYRPQDYVCPRESIVGLVLSDAALLYDPQLTREVPIRGGSSQLVRELVQVVWGRLVWQAKHRNSLRQMSISDMSSADCNPSAGTVSTSWPNSRKISAPLLPRFSSSLKRMEFFTRRAEDRQIVLATSRNRRLCMPVGRCRSIRDNSPGSPRGSHPTRAYPG